MSTLLRGSNTADPKREPFAFASAHQEEQNATYEKSTKDTSLLAIIIIGVFAGFGSIGAVFYLRKRKENSEEEDEWNNNLDVVMNDEVEVGSSYDKDIDMELPAGRSSDTRDSSAYLNTNDAAPFPNRLSNSSPNDAIEADVRVSQEIKGASASYADEKEQCCKPACFGWGDLESSLGFKSSSSPPSTAEANVVEHPITPPHIGQMDDEEEESASNGDLHPPVRHKEDAGYAFLDEAPRNISAARMDPRIIMLNERSTGNEISNVESHPPVRYEEDAGYTFFAETSKDISAARMHPRTSMRNEHMGIDNEFLSSSQQIPMGPDGKPYSQYYMSDDSDAEVGEFDEVSTENGCSASADSRLLFGDSSSASTALVYGAVLFGDSSSTGTTSCASEDLKDDLNNQRRTSPRRMPIDNEMRKKFARRGLQTIRGKIVN